MTPWVLFFYDRKEALTCLLYTAMGSLLIGVFLLTVRLIFKKALSPTAKYLLWIPLAVRLLLPVLPGSPTSVENFMPHSHQTVRQSVEAAVEQVVEAVPIQPEERRVSSPGEMETVHQNNVLEPIFRVWHWGFILLLACYSAAYIRNGRRLHRYPLVMDEEICQSYASLRGAMGISKSIELRYGDRAMIGGFWRPVLLIPRELSGERLEAALTHELMHYLGKDLWIMALWRLLCCFYWFNPVVWLCFWQLKKDCEKACDYAVLNRGTVSPALYAELLYSEGKMNSRGKIGTTAFGANNLKSRIKALLRFKKPTAWMTGLAVGLIIVISACTLTGETAKKPWKLIAQDIEAVTIQDRTLNEDEIRTLTKELRTLTRRDFTENQTGAGITPEWTVDIIFSSGEICVIRKADAPDGGLELSAQMKQWWIDAPALYDFLETLVERPEETP